LAVYVQDLVAAGTGPNHIRGTAITGIVDACATPRPAQGGVARVNELARHLTAVLQLDLPPVGLWFVSEAPDGIPEVGRDFPSSCSFWREAESRTFFAQASRHSHCAIGAMVMGFALPAEVQQRLGEAVSAMTECGYLFPEEAAAIPVMPKAHAGIMYGPLADADHTPDVVLLWVTVKQAMLCGEAIGTAKWTSEPTTITGRPACAALPRAMNGGTLAMSVGCIGMRTFTDISDDRILAAIPGARLADFVADLRRLGAANDTMLGIYRAMRDGQLAAGSPSN
jgi:uncharacterized protein (DUF169 family)